MGTLLNKIKLWIVGGLLPRIAGVGTTIWAGLLEEVRKTDEQPLTASESHAAVDAWLAQQVPPAAGEEFRRRLIQAAVIYVRFRELFGRAA